MSLRTRLRLAARADEPHIVCEVCPVCGVLVEERFASGHAAWHRNMSNLPMPGMEP